VIGEERTLGGARDLQAVDVAFRTCPRLLEREQAHELELGAHVVLDLRAPFGRLRILVVIALEILLLVVEAPPLGEADGEPLGL
jgi:hypothetical protein